jgi:hypothetical protein
MSFWVDGSPSQWDEVMWYNLQPSTVYYWRVGTVYNDDYDHPEWIDERTFTTGQAGGPILPAPILTAPPNNSSISFDNVILTWSPVDGAIEYSVSLLDKTNDSWYGFTTTNPQLDISQSGWFTPASNYEWYIEARNNYAWSSRSTTWAFTITADGFSTKNQRLPDAFFHDKFLDYIYYSVRH